MSRRVVPVVLSLIVVAAACGQKSGVAGTASGGDEGTGTTTIVATTAAPGATTTAAPAPPPSDSSVPGAPGGDPTAPSAPEGSAPPPDSAAPPTTEGPAAGPYTPGPNDTAGVTDDEIVIGVHAPVTGASPIPQTSFDTGKDQYWRYLAESAPDLLFGRNVRVVFRDDTFNPQTAVQVCREMVEQEGAFMLVGAGGADQITACAAYANENGIPYLSAGVNEAGLTGLDTYFAVSPTYAQQAGLIVDQLVAQDISAIGLVVSDTPSFEDGYEAIKAAAEGAGLDIVYEHRLSKEPAEAEVLTVVQQLKSAGATGVVLLSSPVAFIGLAGQGVNQTYTPVWIGPGVTSGLNAVTNFGCPGVETGEFFHPTPSLDVVDALDPDFNTSYEVLGGEPDDIALGLWGLNRLIGEVLVATGPELGRAAFMNAMVTTPEFDAGVYAPVSFTPDDHFGGTGMFLLDADCSARRYTSSEQFVSITG